MDLVKAAAADSEAHRRRAVDYARNHGFRSVTCGHTHLPMVTEHAGVRYINSGTWTEFAPCPFVVVTGNQVNLEFWPQAQNEESAAMQPAEVQAPTAGFAHGELGPRPGAQFPYDTRRANPRGPTRGRRGAADTHLLIGAPD